MNTQTKPELCEPTYPPNVILDTDDYSRIDVCKIPSSNHPDWINVYIYAPPTNFNNILEVAEGLETRFFPGESPKELKNRLVNSLKDLELLRDDKPLGGESYCLAYPLYFERRVYRAVRELK